MFSAGYLEGYLTQQYISDSYYNFVNSVLSGNPEISSGAEQFVLNQIDWINNQIKNNIESNYWRLIQGIMNQLKGMYQGYRASLIHQGRETEILDFYHFYYLTNMGDLEDIIPAFSESKMYVLIKI